MFEEGKGVEKNHAKAMDLLKVAAKNGGKKAKEHLERLRINGVDDEKSNPGSLK